jgi:hypothetical protein
MQTRSLPLYLLVLVSLLVSHSVMGQQENQPKMVIAVFEVSKSLEGNNKIFTDLMSQKARQTPKYNIVLPSEHLAKITDQYRAQIASGANPEELLKDTERQQMGADLMLLPAASKLNKMNVMTATLIDLKTFRSLASFVSKNSGEEEQLLLLVDELWKEVEAWENPEVVEGKKPVKITIFKKETKEAPWYETNTLYSRWFYKVHVKVVKKSYVYGFQKDSVGAIAMLFPKSPKGLPAYSLPNPLAPGAYEIPPDNAFSLDETIGQENFYILYSNIPLSNPLKVLEKHLSGKKIYAGVVTKTIQHK